MNWQDNVGKDASDKDATGWEKRKLANQGQIHEAPSAIKR